MLYFVDYGIMGKYFDTYEQAELYCGENCISCKNIYEVDETDL